MKQYTFLPALLLLAAIVFSCKTEKETSDPQVAVRWILDFNYSDTSDIGMAHFEVKNTGGVPLNDENWNIYFSQMLGQSMPASKDQKYSVEHVSGDWFRVSPKAGFLLKPGDSADIYYTFHGSVDRYSDAPHGVYLVIKGDTAETAFPIENYDVERFTKKEQLFGSRNDDKVLRTPAWLYNQNAGNNFTAVNEKLPVIPSPFSIVMGNDSIALGNALSINYPEELSTEAGLLKEKLKRDFGIDLIDGSADNAVVINLSLKNISVNGIEKEAYELRIKNNAIDIIGSDAAGVFYGTQSLLSLLANNDSKDMKIPVTEIRDSPRYGYRGFHLDVGRNFHDKEEVKKVLDIMASYKLNKFHFYFVEDEGWRIEIPSLPELTEFGSVRGHTSDEQKFLHPSYGSGPSTDSEKGTGFYTREDFIEILKYATDRHIQVIPSINLPGHARSAIYAMEYRYRKLMEQGREKEALEYSLIDPEDNSVYSSAQNYDDNTVNVALDATYHFYMTVFRDVKKMYEDAGLELDFIHTGGDEVAEGAWTGSKYTQQLLEQLPDINNARNLQIYFTRRLLDSLKQYDLTIGGWEEIALEKNDEGKYMVNAEFAGKNVIPYVWNNFGDASDLTYRMIQNGYKVVICHVSNFYLDLAYNNDPEEPGLDWGGFTDEYSPWSFSMKDEAKKMNSNNGVDLEGSVIGLQSQLWSETLVTDERLEYMLLPKLFSFAERAWQHLPAWEQSGDANLKQQEWAKFINTVYDKELPLLARAYDRINYRIPKPGAIIENGKLMANVPYKGLTIHYETGGKTPGENSPVYTEPIEVSGEVKLVAVDKSGNAGKVVTVVK